MNSVALQITQETERLIFQQLAGQITQHIPANAITQNETPLHPALMLEPHTKQDAKKEEAKEEIARPLVDDLRKKAAKSSDLGSSGR